MKRTPITRKTRLTAKPKERGAAAAPRTPMKRTSTPPARTPKADGVQPSHPARTPLARSSMPPAATQGPKRKPSKPTAEKARRAARKAAQEAVLAAAQVIVRDRSQGRCERCLVPFDREAGEVHHRRPRQRGGSMDPAIHSPANLVHLCHTCHRWAEDFRDDAVATGWLVPMGVTGPEEIPVVNTRGRTWLLTAAGDRLAA